MAERVRAFDWSSTPLGPMDRWPQSLRTAVGICLNSRFPMFVWWGPDLINIYNDGYAPMLGKRHPDALGRPARASWADIWDTVGPQADAVLLRGESTWNERVRLVMERQGFSEETFFTWSYSPIPADDGTIGGLFCAVTEETERVRVEQTLSESERRLQLAQTAANVGTWEMDFQTGRVVWSDGIWHLLGRTPGEQAPSWDLWNAHVHPEDRAEAVESFTRQVNSGQREFQLEFRINNARRGTRWLACKGQIVHDKAGLPARVLGANVDITDRKQAEQALQENEARLRALVNASSDVVYRMSADWAIMQPLDGRGFVSSNTQPIADWMSRNIPASEHARVREAIARAIRTKGIFQLEHRVTRADGSPGWTLSRAVPIVSDHGEILEWFGAASDVTDRRKAQEALQEANAAAAAGMARWRAVVAGMTDGVVVADAHGNMAEWNRAALEMHGYASVDEVHKSLDAFVDVIELTSADGDVVPMNDWPMTRVLRGETFAGVELTLRRLDTKLTRVISYSGSPIRDRRRSVALGVLTLHDVTEARRAAAAVLEREARFRELADAMPQIVWVTRPDGYHEYFNRRWYEFTGIADGASDGDGWDALFHPEDRERTWATWRRSLETGEPYEIEYRLRHHSGEYRWTLGRALPIRQGGDGPITRWFGTCTDIDALKRLQQEREQLLVNERLIRADAEAASQMKDEFLATLSHELRTPLNAVLGWSQLLSRGNRQLSDYQDGMRVIERNARAQAKIIDDLLDMSRIIAGKVMLEMQRLELQPVVQAAVDTVRPAADAKGVSLITSIDPMAGAVSGDPNRLQQAFWNLITNAVKFTPGGGEVNVRLDAHDDHAQISITDTGEGIRAEFLPHVFDRFRQADASTTRRHGGLGLGLAIVKQLVELHGGVVRVASAGPGQGSTFTVMLPLTTMPAINYDDADVPSSGLESLFAHSHEPPPAIHGVRVLVVDDEDDARAMARRVLEESGASVRTAASTAEALAIIEHRPPDVLVSDIGMPIEDGYALIRRVRALPTDRGGSTPAVALTAYARAEDRVRAMRAGYQSHVVKPIEPIELVTVVASLAGRHATN